MQELASVSIGTITGRMELNANFGFIVGRQMFLFVQFLRAVCKRTSVCEFTLAEFFPIPAHFCLVFHLIVLHKGFPLHFRVKMSFGTLNGRFLINFLVILFLDVGLLFVNFL
jgi:hypothetical protein